MADTFYECTQCGTKAVALAAECPTCGGLDTYLEQNGLFEPEPQSVERDEDGQRERTPEEIRQGASGELAELGGTPQRPIP